MAHVEWVVLAFPQGAQWRGRGAPPTEFAALGPAPRPAPAGNFPNPHQHGRYPRYNHRHLTGLPVRSFEPPPGRADVVGKTPSPNRRGLTRTRRTPATHSAYINGRETTPQWVIPRAKPSRPVPPGRNSCHSGIPGPGRQSGPGAGPEECRDPEPLPVCRRSGDVPCPRQPARHAPNPAPATGVPT